MARLDDMALVLKDYSEPERLAARFKPFREYHDPDLLEILLDLVAVTEPRRVLEVGSGAGHFSALMRDRLGAAVTSMDQSPMMVGLAAQRGLDALVGDVQRLPFPEETFDVVVANWMLYHVPDLGRGISELHRVLRPGGRLIAATMGEQMMREVWDLLPDEGTPILTFSASNGHIQLARRFEHVERIDLAGTATFPDEASVIEYIEATLTRAHLAVHLPQLRYPLVSTTSNVAFVGTKT